MLVDLFGEQKLRLMEQTGNGAAFLDQLNGLVAHGGVIAAQNRRAAGLQEVVVFVAVDIVQLGAVGLRDDDGERIVERKVVLHAAGDDLFGFFDHGLGLLALFGEVFVFIFFQRCGADGIDRGSKQIVELFVDRFCVMVFGDRKSGIHNRGPPSKN